MLKSTAASRNELVLILSCPDQTGIVSSVASFIAESGGWITEASYYAETDRGWFHTRQVVKADSIKIPFDDFKNRFAQIAQRLGAENNWWVINHSQPKNIVILSSKERHCVQDILERVTEQNYLANIQGIIGNHQEISRLANNYAVDFTYIEFPKAPEDKSQAFEELARKVDEYNPDVIVLAKFMQILPEELCKKWFGKAINIHHSFLPSFIGAKPYKQAFERGVKLVGATCHYVTKELDAGPIIEQNVVRISHKDSLDEVIRKGRDVERLVLAEGLRLHLEDRVLVSGNKTIIFN